ncbi:TPA: phage head morphogenesis protein [Mannheimia haemolytica]|nr:phage head morphogenesis protein [Mannheimia haemolytica]
MRKFTFKQQAQYFEKKLNLRTNSYLDILGEEHDYFFVVAGANRNEVLSEFRKAVDEAIHNGETLENFRKRFDEVVAKTGWEYNGGRNWRTRIIYDTNVYGAYNRGRLQQHLELAEDMPYWEYQHNDNAHPRPQHVAWDGLVLRYDDPFWKYHYPIKAYGCHCTVQALDDFDLKHDGKTVSPPPEIEFEQKTVGVRTGNSRVVTVPKGVDVGFTPHNFDNLKAGRAANVDKLLMQKMVTADPIFASKAVSDLLAKEPVAKLHNQAFKNWVNDVANAKGSALSQVENMQLLGVLPVAVIERLQQINLAPQSAIIAITKGDMVHALRELKQNTGIAVPLEFWEKLPAKLQYPNAILLEKQQAETTLLFIYDVAQTKIAVKVNYDATLQDRHGAKGRQKVLLNRAVTGSLFQDITGLKSSKYEVLLGEM